MTELERKQRKIQVNSVFGQYAQRVFNEDIKREIIIRERKRKIASVLAS
jgi:hypothetical protein